MLKFLCHAIVFALLAGTAPAMAEEGEGMARDKVIVMFGDSLTAGYGLPAAAAVPARLEAELRDLGIVARVVNAGVSGDTTTGGRSRLEWVLSGINDGAPDLVILELGANDALRGVDPQVTRDNLDAMLRHLRAQDIPVLLSGMYAPPNLGREFGDLFNRIYPELAAAHDVPLDPFFLDGVAAKATLNQSDGMHPNEAGAAHIAKRLAPVVADLLRGER